MAKIKRRGESGAAKNYITRTQAIRKLQITLADFRRLCILKGIYPREPLNKKRANKGSTAPTSFYYHKDIQYLLHEPLLARFREHKAFAKKLARAVGRQEWGLAKNLEEAKPVMRLDHLVKERYPTFTLALQDMQDPLNLLHLFSTLPTAPIPGKAPIPREIITDCARLISEWKVWAIKTHSLRKMFLGIKGIYYEISIQSNGKDVPVRWLEGYEFQQHVPTDVDFRILLTFIELYRVLLGFTLFKLYTEENLVYPPPLDKELDERGESVGAFKLVQRNQAQAGQGSGVSKKEVKRVIKGIQAAAVGAAAGNDVDMDGDEDDETEIEAGPSTDNTEENEDFVERPSKDASDDVAQGPLTTFNTILSASSVPADSLLFAPYTFYISRETSTKTWEFVVRAMGGRCITSVQCPDLASKEADAITHVIIDRPVTEARKREMENERKWVWVQPQWVADCVNASRVLGAESYKPGALLPPHLSPWEGDGEQARPWLEKDAEAEANAADVDVDIAEEVEEEEDEEEDEDEDEDEDASTATPTYPPALLASASDPTNPTLLHAAELEAETNGVSSGAFKNQLKEATKMLRAEGKLAPAAAAGKKAKGETGEEDLRKIMMSNKKAKLYEKIKYSNKAKQDEKDNLESKRIAIEKRKRKEARSAGRA